MPKVAYQYQIMTSKNLQAIKMGQLSWKARKSPKELERLKEIGSIGGRNSWEKIKSPEKIEELRVRLKKAREARWGKKELGVAFKDNISK